MNDDRSLAESNGPSSRSSSVIPSSTASRKTVKKEDNNLERDIQNIVRDGKLDAKSNRKSLSIARAALRKTGKRTIDFYCKQLNLMLKALKEVLLWVSGVLGLVFHYCAVFKVAIFDICEALVQILCHNPLTHSWWSESRRSALCK